MSPIRRGVAVPDKKSGAEAVSSTGDGKGTCRLDASATIVRSSFIQCNASTIWPELTRTDHPVRCWAPDGDGLPDEDSDMSSDFYRKERPEVFEARFTAPSPGANWYGLRSHTIFQAKNFAGEKKFAVTVDGKQRKLVATVQETELVIKSQPGDTPAVTLRISEANMHDTLTQDSADRDKSLLYQVARKLCRDHATSSASSPLISGCAENNFARSSAYDGFKLHVVIRFRKPFQNPFVSGLEKEYFLIGRLLDGDCTTIHFLGRTNETRDELVNFFGSRIARPGGA